MLWLDIANNMISIESFLNTANNNSLQDIYVINLISDWLQYDFIRIIFAEYCN